MVISSLIAFILPRFLFKSIWITYYNFNNGKLRKQVTHEESFVIFLWWKISDFQNYISREESEIHLHVADLNWTMIQN